MTTHGTAPALSGADMRTPTVPSAIAMYWDPLRQNLILHQAGERLTVPLTHFVDFKKATDNGKLLQIAGELEVLVTRSGPTYWRGVADRFAYFLARLDLYDTRRQYRRGATEPAVKCRTLTAALCKLLDALEPRDEETTWWLLYRRSLDYERRFDFMMAALDVLRTRYTAGANVSGAVASDLRETYWWTAICLMQLAEEWKAQIGLNDRPSKTAYAGLNDRPANTAYEQAATAYLGILKDEPRINQLDRFLTENGTDIENEVRRVLGIGDGIRWARIKQRLKLTGRSDAPIHERSFGCDEVAARLFIPWFLKRLDIGDALKVAIQFVEDGQLFSLLLAAVFLIAGFIYYSIACFENTADGRINPILYFVVVVSLCLTILLTVGGARTVFAVALPRALLTCLAAWLALGDDLKGAFMNMEDVFFKPTDALLKFLHVRHHPILIANGLAVVAALLISLVAFAFILYEVRHYVWKTRGAGRAKALFRASGVCIVISTEAFICGMAVSPIAMANLRTAIEGYPKGEYCTPDLFFVNIFGSAMALFAGVVVKYLWEGQSVAESLGEPI